MDLVATIREETTDNDWRSGNDDLCRCDACVKERAEFDAWVADTDARWARAEAEGRVARVVCLPSGLWDMVTA